MNYLFLPYHLLRTFRHSVLLAVFGSVSYCKHTPSCSVFMQKSIKEKGILKGGMLGLQRLLSCW